MVCEPASGSTFNQGETTVTCTATDQAGNSSPCSFTVTAECGGQQRPGDQNQDGENDLTDQINLLEILFLGQGRFPCDTAMAHLILLDSNGDGDVDLSDAIYNLRFLLLGGRPRTSRVRIVSRLWTVRTLVREILRSRERVEFEPGPGPLEGSGPSFLRVSAERPRSLGGAGPLTGGGLVTVFGCLSYNLAFCGARNARRSVPGK